MTSRRSTYVAEDALVVVRQFAQAAAPHETGGLIVGVATAHGVWITDFVEVQVTTRRRSRFEIPAGATHAAIDALRAEDHRLGYLGDWHSHPTDVGPSGVDFATLRDLAVGALGRRRLLGLVRRTATGWDFELWAVDRLRLPARADYELAGPLERL